MRYRILICAWICLSLSACSGESMRADSTSTEVSSVSATIGAGNADGVSTIDTAAGSQSVSGLIVYAASTPTGAATAPASTAMATPAPTSTAVVAAAAVPSVGNGVGPASTLSAGANVATAGTARLEPYSLVASQSLSSVIVLWWIPPTDADGASLNDISGYRVYYGSTESALTQFVEVANVGIESYAVTGLAPGTWFFSIEALSSSGLTIPVSQTISATI